MPLSTLRRTPRDAPRKTQGQNRVAAPFLYGSFILYNMPVYPGALASLQSPLLFQLAESLYLAWLRPPAVGVFAPASGLLGFTSSKEE